MIYANINLGYNVQIDPSSSVNNIKIGDNVKIAKNVSAYGSCSNLLEIGAGSYIGMNSILNGYADKLIIGYNVSIAQNVNIMVDSGPNASMLLQRIYPIGHGPVSIGNHVWIGASTIIMPNVTIGDFSIIAAGSFVNRSFSEYSIIGGVPAKLIRKFSEEEIKKIQL